MKTVAFHTIGCKLNQHETNDIERQFAERGWRADRVRRAGGCRRREHLHRDRAIGLPLPRGAAQGPAGISGGHGDRDGLPCPGATRARSPGCRRSTSSSATGKKSAIFDHLDDDGRPRAGRVAAAALAPGTRPAFAPVTAFAGHTRAFVKIQDGCDAGCAYCIVPLARGPNRSLPADAVLAQVDETRRRRLPGDWCSPACTWAPGAATWSRARTLAGLLARLVAIPGLERLRLSSIEPTEFTPELLDLLAASPAICPHLHIPLQSGSAAVLRAMRRPYGPEVFARVVERLALTLPDPGLGADVIAGFPGEREEDFEESVSLIRSLPLTYLHVFPFSPRPGTPAAAMADQVPAAGARSARRRSCASWAAKKPRPSSSGTSAARCGRSSRVSPGAGGGRRTV